MIAMTVQAEEASPGVLVGTMKSIDGDDVALKNYTGRVVLVVNVASRCGKTKQYTQLQDLHETYSEDGLAVLGFPCNQFGAQEPGSDEDVKAFCKTSYGVEFPMFSKIDVNGEKATPLYQYLTSDKVPIKDRGPVKWNFEKFLIDRDGEVIGRFRSGVSPDAPEMVKAITNALDVSEQG